MSPKPISVLGNRSDDVGIFGYDTLGSRWEYPLLVLGTTEYGPMMSLDIGGDPGVKRFFTKDPAQVVNLKDAELVSHLTPAGLAFLQKIEDQLCIKLTGLTLYKGSGGPTHVVAEGILFVRMTVPRKPI